MSRRALAALGGALVLAGALVAVGRWDEQRDIAVQRAGMARMFALAARTGVPEGWRILAPFRCLLYRIGPNPMAIELCFDPQGRLVEALDRRTATLVVSSLRFQTDDASIRVNSGALDDVLRQMGAFRSDAPRATAIMPSLWYHPGLPPPRIPPGSGLPSRRA